MIQFELHLPATLVLYGLLGLATLSDFEDTSTDDNDIDSSDPDETATTDPTTTSSNLSRESGELTANPNVIHSIVENQTINLSQALAELLQNGIDSDEADTVTLDTSQTRTVYTDNGLLDIAGRGESLATEFGLTDKDDDADSIGRFGIGMGQVYAHGHTTILSGEWALHIDIREWGVDYEKIQLHNPIDGVEIHIAHYPDTVPDAEYEWDGIEDNLRKRVRYTHLCHNTEIQINGEEANTDSTPADDIPRGNHVSHTNERGYYALYHSADSSVDIWSNGLYVGEMDIKGVSGIVVSKNNLDVNFSRNDIKDRCPVWKAIQEDIDDLRKEIFESIPDSDLTSKARTAMVELMSVDESLKDDWEDRELLKLANSDLVSINELQDENEVSWGQKGNTGSRTLLQEGHTVLDERDDASSLIQSETNTFEVDAEVVEVADKLDESNTETGYSRIQNEPDLIKKWRQRLLFARLLAQEFGWDSMTIRLGESDYDDSWTDGMTYISLTRDAMDEQLFTQWSSQIFHELCELKAYSTDSREADRLDMSSRKFHRYMTGENFEIFQRICGEVTRNGLEATLSEYPIDTTVHLEG